MSRERTDDRQAKPPEPKPDPWEGVPPGCATPRAWWPFWLGLVGFVIWVGLLLVLLAIRWQTSVV